MRGLLSLGVVILFASMLGAQAPPQAPVGATQTPAAQAGRGGRGAQPGLEPRIVSFEAQPATVRAGQPVLLVWHTENPSGITIEPSIGAVVPRGSRQVTPAVTTTYTLTMKGGPSRTVVVTVEGAAAVAAAGVPAVGPPKPGRMPDGTPDLSGV